MQTLGYEIIQRSVYELAGYSFRESPDIYFRCGLLLPMSLISFPSRAVSERINIIPQLLFPRFLPIDIRSSNSQRHRM